ncbi:MAG: hypothetical protein R3F17_01170 [Planctomycetota bacterium]
MQRLFDAQVDRLGQRLVRRPHQPLARLRTPAKCGIQVQVGKVQEAKGHGRMVARVRSPENDRLG